MSARPIGADIELTNACNARCGFCPTWKVDTLKGFMEPGVFRGLIDRLAKESFQKLMFIGRGEPLLHPHFEEFLCYVRDRSRLSVEVFTNGARLTQEVVDRLAALNTPTLDLRINVSLHSIQPDSYREQTGMKLERLAESIRYLVRQEGRLGHSICFVLNKKNEAEMKQMRRFFDERGVRNVDIALVYNKGGFIPDGEYFDQAFYERVLRPEHKEELAREGLWPTPQQCFRPCWYTYGGYWYFVNYRGEAVLCHDDFEGQYELGDALQDPWETIDAKIRVIRERGGTPQCRRCTKRYREVFHRPHEEASERMAAGQA